VEIPHYHFSRRQNEFALDGNGGALVKTLFATFALKSTHSRDGVGHLSGCILGVPEGVPSEVVVSEHWLPVVLAPSAKILASKKK